MAGTQMKIQVLVFVCATSLFSSACQTTQEDPVDANAGGAPVSATVAAPIPKIPQDRAHLVGREMAEALVSKERLLDSDKVMLFVNRVGQYAAYHLDTGPKNIKCVGGPEKVFPLNGFRFAVFHSLEKQSVALPGGFIFISDALLGDMTTEDQLAGVLAHEVTNVVCQHGMSRIQKVLDSVPKEKHSASFERIWKSRLPARFKKVSDRGALLALYKAGYYPEDYVQFIEKMGGTNSAERVAWMKEDLGKMQAKGVTDTKKSRAARFADFKKMAGI
jgi:hypothetical protein